MAAIAIGLMVTGLWTLVASICTVDEQKRRGVMFEGKFWGLGVVGTRNNTHAYIEFDTPTYYKYTKAGWVVVGVEHTMVGGRQKVYAHLVLPQKPENEAGA